MPLRTDARVAQLDRASVYGTEGYRFESCRAWFHFFGLQLCSGTVCELDGDYLVDAPQPHRN